MLEKKPGIYIIKMNIKKEEMIDDFIVLMDNRVQVNNDTKKIYRIKWRGNFIQKYNGKTVWSSLSGAKNAFNLMIDTSIYKIQYRHSGVFGTKTEFRKYLLDILTKNGILEFVQI